MSERESQFDLPNNIERYLAALSKFYIQEGERQKLEIIVNSQVRIHEGWHYDNWDGGTYGHALYLTIPETLYLSLANQRDQLQTEIADDINKLHNAPNESIAPVFLEMEEVKDHDWRRASGAFQVRRRTITPSTADRIWGDDRYRVFLSHTSKMKEYAVELKEGLELFGISAFVAHQDIKPTQEWQDEIENALASMDSFVALLTENFHDSLWTDQEVGYALGREVPMIAVKHGMDPYGFIGKFQALSCAHSDAPTEIVKLLIKQPQMLECYIKAVQECRSFDQGNILSTVFVNIVTMTKAQANILVSAFNNNPQLQGSFGFSGAKSHMYGDGLADFLSRTTGKEYMMTTKTSGGREIKTR